MRINIASATLVYDWKKQKTGVRLRITADATFVAKDDDNTAVIVEASPSVAREVDVTVTDTVIDGVPTTIVTTPSLWLFSTNDALKDKLVARYSVSLVTKSGQILERLDSLQNIEVPKELNDLNDPTSWTEIIQFNSPAAPVPLDRETFSRTQILELLGQFTGLDALVTREVDGNPTVNPTTILEFNQADGFTLSAQGLGVMRVGMTVGGLANKLDKIGLSTDNAVARWDGAGGDLLQNSVVLIGDTGNITGLGTLNGHGIPAVAADTFLLAAANQVMGGKIIGANTLVGALTVSLGSDGTADMYYRNSSGFLTRLPIGTNGQFLQVSGGLPVWGSGGGGGSITVREEDGSPNVSGVTEIRVSNATLTDNGGGSVSINIGGAGAITGTIASGQVAFGSGANVISGEAAFAYDTSTNKLSLGNTGGSATLDMFWDTGGPGSAEQFNFKGVGGNEGFAFRSGNDIVFQITQFGEVFVLPLNRGAAASLPYFQAGAPSDLALPADTEQIGVILGDFGIFDRQWTAGGGAFGQQREFYFGQPRYNFTSSDTIALAQTVFIEGAPIAGTNATITSAEALRVNAGKTFLNGSLTVNAQNNNDPAISFVGTAINFLRQHNNIQTTPYMTFDAGAVNDLTTGVSIREIWFKFDGSDFNYSTGGVTTPLFEQINVTQRNITSDAATRTITTAASLTIDGAPTQGTNVAITNRFSAIFKADNVRIGTPGTNQPQLVFTASGNSNVTSISSGDSPAGSVQYKLPADTPAAGEVLAVTSFGSGIAVLEWAAAGGGGGSGTVNNGNALRVAYYPTTGTTVDDAAGFEYQPSASPNVFINAQADTHRALAIRPFSDSYSAYPLHIRNAANTAIIGFDPQQNIDAMLTIDASGAGNRSAGFAIYTSGGGSAEKSFFGMLSSGGSLFSNSIGSGFSSVDDLAGVPNTGVLDASGSGGLYLVAEHSGGIIVFGTGGFSLANERARFDSSGVFGINTTTINAQTHIKSGATNRQGLRVDGLANSSVELLQFNHNVSNTATVANMAIFSMNSNGTAAANFGQALQFNLESSTTNDRIAASMFINWGTATDASRTSNFGIQLSQNASIITMFSIVPTNSTNGNVEYFFGNPNGQGAAASFLLNVALPAGTNIAGSNLTLVGGRSTGNANVGAVTVKYPLISDASAATLRGLSTNEYPVNTTMGTLTGAGSFSATASETSFFNGGVFTGTRTIEANAQRIGRIYRVRCSGVISCTTNATFRVRVKLGSTTIIDSTAVALNANAALTNAPWWTEFFVIVQAIGSSGQVGVSNQAFYYSNGTTNLQVIQLAGAGVSVVDFTANKDLEITGQFNTNNASNSFTCDLASFQIGY